MRYEKVNGGYLVRLELGEEVLTSLCDFIAKKRIGGGAVTGIGAVENVTLGYFDRSKVKYLEKKFPGVYELVNLTGNIAYVEGQPFVHAHVVISGRRMTPYAGHLFSGTIAVTGEFFIFVAGKKFTRKQDSRFTLKLLEIKKTIR